MSLRRTRTINNEEKSYLLEFGSELAIVIIGEALNPPCWCLQCLELPGMRSM